MPRDELEFCGDNMCALTGALSILILKYHEIHTTSIILLDEKMNVQHFCWWIICFTKLEARRKCNFSMFRTRNVTWNPLQHLLSVKFLGQMVLQSDIHDFTHNLFNLNFYFSCIFCYGTQNCNNFFLSSLTIFFVLQFFFLSFNFA